MRFVIAAAAAAACLAGAAAAQSPEDGLSWPPALDSDVDALPRLSGPGVEALNARLQALDDAVAQDRAGCLAEGGPNAYWGRAVSAPFTGPRFLTVVIDDDYYCGGPHPSIQFRRLTFDRTTGRPADWATLWPGVGWTPVDDPEGDPSAETRDPRLWSWYRAAVLADPETDPAWLADCGDYYSDDLPEDALALWLDAEAGGVAMDWASLPHVALACGAVQVMPVEEAARLGASPELIQALEGGRAEVRSREAAR